MLCTGGASSLGKPRILPEFTGDSNWLTGRWYGGFG